MNTLDLEVLVLNKGWVPIRIERVQTCLGQMAADNARALDFTDDSCVAVPWVDWLKLPVRELFYFHGEALADEALHSTRLTVRAPRVVVLTKYSRVPTKRRRMTMRNVCEYYQHRCAYTGKKLTKTTRSLDHVIPRSQGGQSTWDNVVPCDKQLNSWKANRTPAQAKMKLLIKPSEPRKVPFTEILKSILRERDDIPKLWMMFVSSK